jgi:hypothetical protein
MPSVLVHDFLLVLFGLQRYKLILDYYNNPLGFSLFLPSKRANLKDERKIPPDEKKFLADEKKILADETKITGIFLDNSGNLPIFAVRIYNP